MKRRWRMLSFRVGVLGTAADVARAIVFLASPQADFITGQVLGVNGGFVI